jgi:hypothetical protein
MHENSRDCFIDEIKQISFFAPCMDLINKWSEQDVERKQTVIGKWSNASCRKETNCHWF